MTNENYSRMSNEREYKSPNYRSGSGGSLIPSPYRGSSYMQQNYSSDNNNNGYTSVLSP